MNVRYYPTYTSTQIQVEKQRFYMGTSCAPLLIDCSFIHMRETSYRGFLKINEKKLARSFNFTFRYIDAVLSLHNTTCSYCVDHI